MIRHANQNTLVFFAGLFLLLFLWGQAASEIRAHHAKEPQRAAVVVEVE